MALIRLARLADSVVVVRSVVVVVVAVVVVVVGAVVVVVVAVVVSSTVGVVAMGGVREVSCSCSSDPSVASVS